MTTQPLTQPGQRMVRMMDGRMVPALPPIGSAKPKTKRFLVVVQHYDGDLSAAEELASLIADLERTRNHEADVMVLRRGDSREISSIILEKLRLKFDTVHSVRSRRADAKGHPWGCNSMFYDLVAMMADDPRYRDSYYAFINLETDCVPTRPGWIGELIAEWRGAAARGRGLIGEKRTDPQPHFNGLAVYAADIGRRVGARKLSGGDPRICYDIRHGPTLLPLAEETPLIYVDWRKPTVTAAELFAPRREDTVPAIYHGVKDASARDLVRSRYVASLQTKRPNVYTYITQTNLWGNDDRQACLDLWRQGWMSRGWNPVILSRRDAVKHPRFPQFEAALAKLPCAGDRAQRDADLLRWLALDSAGGGLLVRYDVLPDAFTGSTELPSAMSFRVAGEIVAANLSAEWCGKFVERIVAYDAQPEDMMDFEPHVDDVAVMRGALESIEADGLHRFDVKTIGNKRPSVAMAEFLRGSSQ